MGRYIKFFLQNFEEFMSGTCLAVMILALLVQAIVRATVGSAVAWAEELSRFALIWSVYFAMALASKRYEHVCVTVQFSFFSQRIRFICRVIRDLVWVFFNVFIAYTCCEVIYENLEFPEISQTLGFPKNYVEAVIPVAFILSSIRILQHYYIHWKNGTLKDMTI